MKDKVTRLSKRNDLIRDEYMALWNKGYRSGYCLDRLAQKYFLSIDTVERIVMRSGTYKDM